MIENATKSSPAPLRINYQSPRAYILMNLHLHLRRSGKLIPSPATDIYIRPWVVIANWHLISASTGGATTDPLVCRKMTLNTLAERETGNPRHLQKVAAVSCNLCRVRSPMKWIIWGRPLDTMWHSKTYHPWNYSTFAFKFLKILNNCRQHI